MKKLLLLMAVAIFTLAGCDDNNGDKHNYAPDVVGDYDGHVRSSSNMYANVADDDMTLEVASAGEKVDVALATTRFGSYSVDNVTVSYSGGVYTLSGSGTALVAMGGGPQMSKACTLAGTVRSATNAEITFTIPESEMGLPMGALTTVFKTGGYILGVYEGYTSAYCPYFTDRTADDQTIIITADNNGKVYFSFASSEWGTYEDVELTVTSAIEGYDISATGTVEIAGHGGVNNYDYTIEGNIVSASDATITISISMMGTTVVNFILGDMPA